MQIDIQLPSVFANKKWEQILQNHLAIAREKIDNKIQYALKEKHRYKHQTRNLRNASTVKKKQPQNGELLHLEVGVNEKKAPYAKYVIDGHGSWVGDPFVDEAVDNNKDFIMQQIQAAVDRAVAEINRS